MYVRITPYRFNSYTSFAQKIIFLLLPTILNTSTIETDKIINLYIKYTNNSVPSIANRLLRDASEADEVNGGFGKSGRKDPLTKCARRTPAGRSPEWIGNATTERTASSPAAGSSRTEGAPPPCGFGGTGPWVWPRPEGIARGDRPPRPVTAHTLGTPRAGTASPRSVPRHVCPQSACAHVTGGGGDRSAASTRRARPPARPTAANQQARRRGLAARRAPRPAVTPRPQSRPARQPYPPPRAAQSASPSRSHTHTPPPHPPPARRLSTTVPPCLEQFVFFS